GSALRGDVLELADHLHIIDVVAGRRPANLIGLVVEDIECSGPWSEVDVGAAQGVGLLTVGVIELEGARHGFERLLDDLALEHDWSASKETVGFLNALVKVTKENYLTDTIGDKAKTRRLWLNSSIVFAFGHEQQIERIIGGDEALLAGLRDLMPLVEKDAKANFAGDSAANMLLRISRVINLLDFFGHNFSEKSFKNVLAAYPEPNILQKTWGGMRSAYVLLSEDPRSELGRKLIELDSDVFGP
ncbi:hypothetical protein LCGC14_2724040, partial [marine sediment metagenome]